jgi:exosome complex RNA-binding protein Rrp42 (RNase PH superfamily)
MSFYSDNEIAFFKQLLLDFDVRVDGRDKMELRKYKIEHNIINNCFSSLKLTYNNSKNEIFFTIKGELIKGDNTEDIIKKEKSEGSDLKIIINIDSMGMTNRGPNSEEYKAIKNKMESLINKLMISKINTDSLIINKTEPKLYWKLYLDIFVFDELRMSIFQLISIGVKHTLLNVKVPKLIVFQNEIDDKFEYDLRKNYEDLTVEESEEKINLEVPNILVFSIVNNCLYLDPCDEEMIITPSSLFVSEVNKKLLNIESIGDSVEPILYSQIAEIIKNIKAL